MEPVETPIVYTIRTRITNVEQRFHRFHVGGIGKEAMFNTRSIGWFIHMEGSHEGLYLGDEQPELLKGDEVVIQIRKAK